MNYIYLGAAFAAVAWIFYMIGQYTGLKEMNRRLNASADETEMLRSDKEEAEQEARRQAGHIENLQNLCAAIVALDNPNAAHGVKKAVEIARAGVAK